VTIIDSTVNGNQLRDFGADGAGIWGGSVEVINSTISGNLTYATQSYFAQGGGIYADNVTVRHSTITGNAAGGLGGGGISANNATIDHSIIAGNSATNSSIPDISASAGTIRFSLVGDATGAFLTNLGGNLLGNPIVPIDPLLLPLDDYGGS